MKNARFNDYAPQIFTPAEHYAYLHHEPHGTVPIWEKVSGSGLTNGRWVKAEPDSDILLLLNPFVGAKDCFISINQFGGWRKTHLLKSLRCCYVDIDGCEDIELAIDTLMEQRLPAPTAVILSGRGLHLYWLLEPVPAKALPVWQRVQNRLVQSLATIGADLRARDCTRVLRMAGTVNSRSNTAARGLILSPERWTLHELANEVLGYREDLAEETRQKARNKRGAVRSFDKAAVERGLGAGIYTRWHLVYQDLRKIIDDYWFGGVVEQGHRDILLYHCANAMSWFCHYETLEAEILDVAREITPDFNQHKVLQYTQSVLGRAKAASEGKTLFYAGQEVDPRYRYKRQTLYDDLSCLIRPHLLPQLRAIIPDELAEQRKRDRDRVAEGRYKQTREEYEQQALMKASRAKELKELGWSIRRIAKELECSIGAVSGYINT